MTPPPTAPIFLLSDIALALLRSDRATEGRLWLLLRVLDTPGQGWVRKETAVIWLTDPDSPLYLCHERYLRILLKRGDGLFWIWQKGKNGRIWLRSDVKVAAGLGLKRVGRTAVAISPTDLLKPLSHVRATFYAIFHASRIDGKESSSFSPSCQPQTGSPISRDTLTDLSGVSRHTQYRYEQQAGIGRQTNIAVGLKMNDNNLAAIQEQAWKYGRGSFVFTDKKGLLGSKGDRYQARQLPNSYYLYQPRQTKRQRRRIPTLLGDLRQNGDAGNGQKQELDDTAVAAGGSVAVGGNATSPTRRYFANGTAAAKALRSRAAVGYWGDIRASASRLWHPLPGLIL